MIINAQSETLLLILRSFLSGIILGVVYDVFTVALKKPASDSRAPVKVLFSVLLFLFDFLFCLLCAAVSLLLMYYSNRGFFRALVFVLMFLGFTCFRLSYGTADYEADGNRCNNFYGCHTLAASFFCASAQSSLFFFIMR